MILVDTSVWIEHFRSASAILTELLDGGEVLGHPFVLGELALANLRQRDDVLRMLRRLPQATNASHPEVQAVGVGASRDNPREAAILFFVTAGQPRTNIPSQVEGLRTRIVEGPLFARRGAISAEESAQLEQSVAAAPDVYPVSESELARAQRVHAAHAEEQMSQPGVQGVGISSSLDAPGEAALMIFLVRGATHNPIPTVIDGLRTRVRESSRFRAGYGDAGARPACTMPASKTVLRKPAANH